MGSAIESSCATVTSKGQVTIPAAVRKQLNLSVGDKLQFVQLEDGDFKIMLANKPVTALKGMFKVDKAISVEQMNQAVEDGWSGK